MGDSQFAPVLFFVHIPKCGGTSCRSVLRRWLGEDLLHLDTHEPRDLEARIAAHGCPPRALIGHFPHGLHEATPCLRPIYVSLVRDPIERTVSIYKHARANPDHFFHAAAAGASFEAFYDRAWADKRSRRQLRGLQCYFLSRRRTFEETRETIDDAFHLVAPVERAQQLMDVCAHVLGVEPHILPRRNAQAGEPELGAEAAALAERMRHDLREDDMLYRHVRDGFDARLALAGS